MKRPFHALTALGVLAHNGYELAAGVGLVGQHKLGFGGSSALWGAGIPAFLAMSTSESPRWNAPLAFGSGASLAGAGVHFALWPWEFRRGLPTLTEAEGLKPGQLPAYNAILLLWAAAAAMAMLAETPRGARKWAIAGMLTTPLLKSSAQGHFAWLREEARTNPAWWNRAVAEGER